MQKIDFNQGIPLIDLQGIEVNGTNNEEMDNQRNPHQGEEKNVGLVLSGETFKHYRSVAAGA